MVTAYILEAIFEEVTVVLRQTPVEPAAKVALPYEKPQPLPDQLPVG
jgi:hypothetical protein